MARAPVFANINIQNGIVNIPLPQNAPVIAANLIDEKEFEYRNYDPAPALHEVKNWSTEKQIGFALVSCVVGRITDKKKDHIIAFDDAATQFAFNEPQLDAQGQPVMVNNVAQMNRVTLNDLIGRFDDGGLVSGFQYNQLSSACIVACHQYLMSNRVFIALLNGHYGMPKYAQPQQPWTFDFAANFPLTQDATDIHIAMRLYRSLTIPGYISPLIQVIINQINFAKASYGIVNQNVGFNMVRVQQAFNTIARDNDQKFIDFPINKVIDAFSAESGKRNDETTSTARVNRDKQIKADAAREILTEAARQYSDANDF